MFNMNVIFLDIDGVLNRWGFTKNTIPGHSFIGIDPENLSCFLNFLYKTDFKIVLCSSWRKKDWLIEHFKDVLGPRFIDRYIDNTCEIYNEDENGCRHKEIETWLNLHPETDKWIVLDDLDYIVNSDVGVGIKPFIHSLEGFTAETAIECQTLDNQRVI